MRTLAIQLEKCRERVLTCSTYLLNSIHVFYNLEACKCENIDSKEWGKKIRKLRKKFQSSMQSSLAFPLHFKKLSTWKKAKTEKRRWKKKMEVVMVRQTYLPEAEVGSRPI